MDDDFRRQNGGEWRVGAPVDAGAETGEGVDFGEGERGVANVRVAKGMRDEDAGRHVRSARKREPISGNAEAGGRFFNRVRSKSAVQIGCNCAAHEGSGVKFSEGRKSLRVTMTGRPCSIIAATEPLFSMRFQGDVAIPASAICRAAEISSEESSPSRMKLASVL